MRFNCSVKSLASTCGGGKWRRWSAKGDIMWQFEDSAHRRGRGHMAASTQSMGFEFKEARPFAASGKKPTTPLNYKFDASSRFAVQVQVVASRKFCLHLDLGSAFRRPKPRCARYHAARVLLAIVAPS